MDLECDIKESIENKSKYQSLNEKEKDNVNVLAEPNIRSIYLITYSRADLSRYATRQEFASTVQEAFRQTSKCSDLLQWACSRENHKEEGVHYHMAVKLCKLRRWLRIKRYLECTKGLQVHVSDVHSNYYGAWQYAMKDAEYLV